MSEGPEQDAELMRRVAQGDAAAFRTLSGQHLGAIVTYATRLMGNQAEGEEIAQETFLRAWQRADTYEPRARVRTWLHRIAHNAAIDRQRRRGLDTAQHDDERDQAPDSAEPGAMLEQKARAEGVREALERLPARQKQALLLCHEQGLTGAEIAEVLGVGREAVESLLSRGRRRLRELLTEPGS